MSYKNILYKISDNIAEVVLNRPEKMNSLDETLITDITNIFQELSNNKQVKSIILTGAGNNFCSGLYLDYLQKISQFDIIQNKEDSRKFKTMLLSIYECSKPVIAKVSGYALAGGCGIATACDFIIADETAKFGYTEVKIGFIPAIVMIFLQKRVSETHLKELMLTAKIIDVNEALKIGLINQVVNQNVLDSKVRELCQTLNQNSSSSLAFTKELLRNLDGMAFENALNYACNLNTITRVTPDCKKGVADFLNKKK